MRVPLARRTLRHEWARSALSVLGISVALTLCFLQLGLLSSLDGAAKLVTAGLRFDLVLRSPSYTFLPRVSTIPRRRLHQALAHPDVVAARPLHTGSTTWLDEETGVETTVFVLGIDPASGVCRDPVPALDLLERPDHFLLDRSSHELYGGQEVGRRVLVGKRRMTLGGTYRFGVGMVELGMVLVGERGFRRLFPSRSPEAPTLGLLELRPGADTDAVAKHLRRILPADVTVATRAVHDADEARYWASTTPTGLMFGSGAAVGMIVATVVLYQVLANLIAKYLPQFATLKALGYGNEALTGLVWRQAMLLVGLAFACSLPCALALYHGLREISPLPVELTLTRVLFVAGFASAIAWATGRLTVRKAHRSDPAELFS